MTKENKEANVGEVRVKERNATTTESVKSLHCRTLWSFSRPTANVKQRARNEQWGTRRQKQRATRASHSVLQGQQSLNALLWGIQRPEQVIPLLYSAAVTLLDKE